MGNSHSQYITDTFKCTMCNSNLFIDPYQNINDAQLTAAIQASLDEESLCRGIKEVETVAETAPVSTGPSTSEVIEFIEGSTSSRVKEYEDGNKWEDLCLKGRKGHDCSICYARKNKR